MANVNITITVPSAKVQTVIDAITGLNPIPKERDQDGNFVNKYTPAQWAKEWLRRQIVKEVQRYKTMQRNRAPIQDDDSVATVT